MYRRVKNKIKILEKITKNQPFDTFCCAKHSGRTEQKLFISENSTEPIVITTYQELKYRSDRTDHYQDFQKIAHILFFLTILGLAGYVIHQQQQK